MDFIDFKNPYIDKDKMESLISFVAESGEYVKRGGNSKCSIVGDYAVLNSPNIFVGNVKQDQIISNIQNLKEQGVNVVPVLGYATIKYGQAYKDGSQYARGYIIQEKAQGSEVYESSNAYSTPEGPQMLKDRASILANATQEQYDKFISDFKAITDTGIAIDAAKNANFFYDKDKGFSFIDLGYSGENLFSKQDPLGNQRHWNFIYHALVSTSLRPACLGYGEERFTEKDLLQLKTDNAKVCFKMLNGLRKIGITEEDIKYAFTDQRNEKGSLSAHYIFGFDNYEEFTQFCEENFMEEENTEAPTLQDEYFERENGNEVDEKQESEDIRNEEQENANEWNEERENKDIRNEEQGNTNESNEKQGSEDIKYEAKEKTNEWDEKQFLNMQEIKMQQQPEPDLEITQ